MAGGKWCGGERVQPGTPASAAVLVRGKSSPAQSLEERLNEEDFHSTEQGGEEEQQHQPLLWRWRKTRMRKSRMGED